MAGASPLAVLELQPTRGRRRGLPHGAVIGRDAACDVRLDDPLVSRRHAVVFSGEAGTVIEDLSSANGLYLNGDRCGRTGALNPGDVIQLGSTVWRVVD
jgi:pSer/pThr/pTyr-binding forkhead associated (FHA) protein